ncbi:hypothetical protein VB265_07350 [Enterobacter sichuanensis]|uniref:hypothetical protein n=1 Tax=Enterobacter sichuanensis TaxID=2071710 RepID=UPI002B20CEC4|nr:hypothetical protein [Enterobacter sichuanensis]MEA5169330.1 hypothetical protein [Enterobacter sichuanensis]
MMSIHKRWLSFVLLDDISFKELLTKLEQVFERTLICEDEEGRYIAKAECDGFTVTLIDKEDRLSEFLCDENYSLEITIRSDDYFNSNFENFIKETLRNGNIKWGRSVWAPDKLSQ